MAFLDLLAARAATLPDHGALAVDGGGDLTFGSWHRRSFAVAAGLRRRGVVSGDRVGLVFGLSEWTHFAVAYAGVLKAGAVAVVQPAGAGGGALERAMAHARVRLILDRQVAAELAGEGAGDVAGDRPGDGDSAVGGDDPDAVVELLYPAGWLAVPHPVARTNREVSEAGAPLRGGVLVHAWASGSWAGQHVIGAVTAGAVARAISVSVFEPARFGALVAGQGADVCGLTPALAAALAASDTDWRRQLRGVRRFVLSAPPSDDLRASLARSVPAAEVVVLERPTVPDEQVAAPLASSQEGMVWHERFSPGSFNLPCLVRRYQGHLDVAALSWAFDELARRHEPLRSRFRVAGGRAKQVVAPAAPANLPAELPADLPVDLPVDDVADLPAPERDLRVGELLADATERPFDLATGPLFEPRLVRLGDDDHLVVVRLHHTVFDDWSVDVFRRELSKLYAAALAGGPATPPPDDRPVSFLELARAERAFLDGDAGATQQAWWRVELAGAPLAVQLPIGDGDDDDDDNGGRGAGRTSALRVDLPAPLARRIRGLAARLRATPYMTMLAAFSVVVARWTGLDDLVIASVVAHRNRTETERLIGCFTKKVPVRLRVEGGVTFADLVSRTRTALLGAMAHQDLPFEAAVEAGLGPAAAAHGVVPQLNVVFQAETPRMARLDLPGLTISPYEAPAEARTERHFSRGPAGTTGEPVWGDGIYLKTFLILSLAESGPEMGLVARGSFSRPAVERLVGDLVGLLEEVVAAPEQPVAVPTPSEPDADALELRGFRACRGRIEEALGRTPGVGEVAVAVCHARPGGNDPRVVAYVVPQGDRPPSLPALRRALWSSLPGTVWPAASVVVASLPRRADGRLDVATLPPPAPGPGAAPDPDAGLLAAMWSEVRGRSAAANDSYWQDFSFLDLLAQARAAGLAIADTDVARCRTLAMLAAARARSGLSVG